MSFGAAVRSVLSQYATFTGRARRSEYWWWTLASTLVFGALYAVALVLAGGSAAMQDPSSTGIDAGGTAALLVLGLMGLLSLAVFLPALAVTVRRLHDTGRSGWWYLISFVPLGSIVLLVFAVMDSAPGPNEHGPNPKGVGGQGGYGYGAPQGYGAQQAYSPQGYGSAPGYGGAAPDPRFGTPPQG